MSDASTSTTTTSERQVARRARARAERGIAIAMTGLLIIPLMVFAAIGVDLASWYARISELQRGADAASLAGAVWMPALGTARTAAENSLLSNGLHPTVDPNITFLIERGSTPTSLRVTVTDNDARRHFSQIFVDGDAELTRYAEAEYNLPLPMGSPLHYFGGDGTRTHVPDVDNWSVTWPLDYGSRAPANTSACNVGTSSGQGLGRWTGLPSSPSFSAGGFSGSTRCVWTVSGTATAGTTGVPPPDHRRRPPTNPTCRVRQGGSGSGTVLGRWTSGSPPIFSTSTSGAGSPPMCTWQNMSTDASSVPSFYNSLAPTNRPCMVGYNNSHGWWESGGVHRTTSPPIGLSDGSGNRLCTWSAVAVNNPIVTPNPIDPSRSPGFWAQIHGPGADSQSGDAYSTRCLTSTNCATPNNPLYIDSGDADHGYWYVIKPPPGGGSVTISIFDAQLTPGGLSSGTGDSSVTGTASFQTRFRVYRQLNPLDSSLREPVTSSAANQEPLSCNWRIDEQSEFRLTWVPLCTVSMAANSSYLLQVRTLTNGSSNSAGRNSYAIQACRDNNCDTTTGQPSIHALERMTIFNNIEDGEADFYFAEVGPQYAGRTLVLELYDPGEVSGTAWMYPRRPSATTTGASQFVAPAMCEITSTRASYPRGSDLNNNGSCSIRTADGSGLFNNEWVTFRIEIPDTYTCTPGVNPETTVNSCWWGMYYDISGSATDTTTWRARIEGNPLQLTQ